MPHPLGARVLVKSLGKTGCIVEIGRNRYRVAVGAVITTCREDDVVAAGPARRASRGAPLPAAHNSHEPSAPVRSRLETLDLHGLTVAEALEAVEARLDAALVAGLDHLDIIHGQGTGRVKQAVHRYLGQVGAVRRFEVTQANPGVTRAFL